MVPQDGVLFGAYVSSGPWEDHGKAVADVEAREADLGRRLAINHHFYAWGDTFPTELEEDDVGAGRIPLVSWQSTRLDEILDGAHDERIRQRARDVAAFGEPLFLRWNWEMNGDWSDGSGPRNSSEGRTDGPDKYVSAWRHVRTLFREEGAVNAAWVWCPNAVSSPNEEWNAPSAYYPGDDWVDWVGVDTYNWGRTRSWSTWDHLVETVAPFQDEYGDRKPIMIAETSAAQDAGDKDRWIERLRTDLPERLPGVAALVWFDVDKEEDWRMDSSPQSMAALRRLVADPYFSPPHEPGRTAPGTAAP